MQVLNEKMWETRILLQVLFDFGKPVVLSFFTIQVKNTRKQ